MIEQLQVRVKEPASGQGASSSGLSSVTFIYCLNPFPAGLMGWTREGDIARNFFLHFSKGQLSEREEIPFLTGIWFSFPLFSLFLNPLVSWILGLFFSQGVSSLGVSFFPCPSFLPSWEESFPTVEVLVLRSHNSWYSYYLRESWVFSLDTFQMSFDGLGIRRSSCCFFPCSSIVLQGFFPVSFITVMEKFSLPNSLVRDWEQRGLFD